MRALLFTLVLAACSSRPAPVPTMPPTPSEEAARAPAPATPAATPAATSREVMAADTPRTTVGGNTFVAPAGWAVEVRGPMTLVIAPEGDLTVALLDLPGATSAEDALAKAWKAYRPDARWPLQVTTKAPDKEGWSQISNYAYQTSPNEKRAVAASTMYANGAWSALIFDGALATAEKRGGQLGVIFGQLLPKGGARESFAGRPAATLDKARLAKLTAFIESAQAQLKVPGVALGIVQGGKVVFAGGFGVRQVGKPAKVDADTKFMIASNTKALTTLMLAKLVDENKLTWETPATQLLPSFKLGDADTTSRVQVKHLICACTGMPRQDLEWLFEFADLTPAKVMAALGGMQPTSKFGELFQYSNPLAAAAGYVGGHVAFPKLELGKAYDEAMRTRVFAPLGMKDTTFDYARAQRGNFALPHGHDLKDEAVPAAHAVNYAIIPVRPAGAAWSTVRDVLRYVQMELDRGALPGGKRYVSEAALLARRAPQVAVAADVTYGMGLMVDASYGVPVVHHGGDSLGYHSDMMWLPEVGVGAVVLTNGDGGSTIRSLFRRKLLEVLFDGKPEADAQLAASAKALFAGRAAEHALYTVPADPAAAGALAASYASPEMGGITVKRQGAATVFDFGEFASEVATKRNPDGTVSFVTLAPGIEGFELVVGARDGKRTLVTRDGQHEYVFTER